MFFYQQATEKTSKSGYFKQLYNQSIYSNRNCLDCILLIKSFPTALDSCKNSHWIMRYEKLSVIDEPSSLFRSPTWPDLEWIRPILSKNVLKYNSQIFISHEPCMVLTRMRCRWKALNEQNTIPTTPVVVNALVVTIFKITDFE